MAETTLVIPTELVEEMKQLEKRLGPAAVWTLRQRHELGSAVLEALERKANGLVGRYGAKLTDQLATVLGLDRGVLNKHKQFAVSFDEEALTHLEGVRLPNGEPLAWSHVRLLMELENTSKRRDLIEKAADKGWTSARLAVAIREIKGKKTHGGGPKPIKPQDLTDLIQQMSQLLSEWESRHEQVWSKDDSLIALTKAMPRRQSKEKTIEMLTELRQGWLRAVVRSQEMVKDVDLAIDKLRGKDGGAAKKTAAKE